MDEKYRQLIEALASKLGTTAEHLWDVLVRQAPISGAVDLVLCVVIVAAVWWWVSLVERKTTRMTRTEDNRYPCAEWGEEAAGLAWVSVVFAVGAALVIIVASAQGIVAAFANREYWALMRLVK
jgi:hypothetical protein